MYFPHQQFCIQQIKTTITINNNTNYIIKVVFTISRNLTEAVRYRAGEIKPFTYPIVTPYPSFRIYKWQDGDFLPYSEEIYVQNGGTYPISDNIQTKVFLINNTTMNFPRVELLATGCPNDFCDQAFLKKFHARETLVFPSGTSNHRIRYSRPDGSTITKNVLDEHVYFFGDFLREGYG